MLQEIFLTNGETIAVDVSSSLMTDTAIAAIEDNKAVRVSVVLNSTYGVNSGAIYLQTLDRLFAALQGNCSLREFAVYVYKKTARVYGRDPATATVVANWEKSHHKFADGLVLGAVCRHPALRKIYIDGNRKLTCKANVVIASNRQHEHDFIRALVEGRNQPGSLWYLMDVRILRTIAWLALDEDLRTKKIMFPLELVHYQCKAPAYDKPLTLSQAAKKVKLEKGSARGKAKTVKKK